MNDSANPPELRHDFMYKGPAVSQHAEAFRMSVLASLVDDATQIIQRVPFLEKVPARLWEPGLISELAEASDRLAALIGKLQEAQGENR